MSTTTSDFRTRERLGPRNIEARDYESTPSLVRRLVDDVSTLFAQELELLKSETTESIRGVKAGAISLAMGGAVLFMGIGFLLLAGVYGLSTVMEPWMAALIVGGVVTLMGIIMLVMGRNKLEPEAMTPRRTTASLRKDTNMIKGVTKHEHE